jgi:hypothetical protein
MHIKMPLIAVGALLLGAVFSSAASALTITFEEPAGMYDPGDPGGGEHGPYSWIEGGARYSGFWFDDVGTPQGASQIGHTHLNINGFGGHNSDLPHSWVDDLQGGLVTLIGGGAFDVVSIDYRIEQREIEPGIDPWSYFEQRQPWSVPAEDVHLLLATSVNPVAVDFATFESQFTAFDIDDGSVLDLGNGMTDWRRPAGDLMMQTLNVTGFDGITSLYISHTAHFVWIDNIVIRPSSLPTPEPGTATLLALGLGLLAHRRSKRRRQA